MRAAVKSNELTKRCFQMSRGCRTYVLCIFPPLLVSLFLRYFPFLVFSHGSTIAFLLMVPTSVLALRGIAAAGMGGLPQGISLQDVSGLQTAVTGKTDWSALGNY